MRSRTRRGFAVTAVELGPALAAQARRNLAPFERVTVVNADFETWQPATLPSPGTGRPGPGRPPPGYGLVFAATAWHWIDPAVKYAKAASLLRPGGYLAFWEAVHVVPDGGDPFFAQIQQVYDSIGSGGPGGGVFPRPGRPGGLVRRHWGAVLHVAAAPGSGAPVRLTAGEAGAARGSVGGMAAANASAGQRTAQARKLGLKPGLRIALDAPPDGWALDHPPAGLLAGDADGAADIIIAFFRAADEIASLLPALARRVFPAGAVWALWPRRAAGHASDITDNVVRSCALAVGLVDVKVAAVDEDWSGLRLVWRTENR